MREIDEIEEDSYHQGVLAGRVGFRQYLSRLRSPQSQYSDLSKFPSEITPFQHS